MPGKGLAFYRPLLQKFSKQIKIHALGGVDQKNLGKIISSGCKGFSSKGMIEQKMNKTLISYLNLIARNL
jgi:thiamine monophosphate synthase